MLKKFTLSVCILSLLFTSILNAETQKMIVCPVAFITLSWEWNKVYKRYLSDVHVKSQSGDNFMGVLASTTSNRPSDLAPRLGPPTMYVEYIHDRNIWLIDCKYTIGNSEIEDITDGMFHMRAQVKDETVNCSVLDNVAICNLTGSRTFY